MEKCPCVPGNRVLAGLLEIRALRVAHGDVQQMRFMLAVESYMRRHPSEVCNSLARRNSESSSKLLIGVPLGTYPEFRLS
jgi:hypothetical protein